MINTTYFSHLVFFLILCGIGGPIHAQTLQEQIEECSKNQVSLIRLQCYDRLTQKPVLTQPAETTRKKFRLRRNKNQATEEARNESVTDESKDVISQKSSGTSSVNEIDESIETFGNERIAQVEDETDQITSRILGEFKGWSGYTKFQLENGQIWQQSSEGLLIVRINNPTVIIKKSFFGTYNLNVEGVNSTVKVRRIQ
ncbi:uncharacterized protein METZ01_LOCUS217703 [marine metagenome]|uniref:Uncharacterized protein n=1 Tax=marine metagenome TaxID=408172 RepID=A0A382FQA2_9ZZZZ